MEIILGIVLFLGLLYGWLVGHWFARVVMALALWVLGGFIAILFAANGTEDQRQATIIAVIFGGSVLSWLIAGLPTYYWRQKRRLWEPPSLHR